MATNNDMNEEEDTRTSNSSSAFASTNTKATMNTTTTSTPSSKEQPRSTYKVRFGGGGGAPERTVTTKRPVPRSNNNKVNRDKYVGKADPVRDIGIFAGFIGFMLLISYMYHDVGRPNPENKSSLGKLQSMKKSMNEALKQAASLTPRIEPRLDCHLFLAPSAIPNGGIILSLKQTNKQTCIY
jgi:hypothetical protein